MQVPQIERRSAFNRKGQAIKHINRHPDHETNRNGGVVLPLLLPSQRKKHHDSLPHALQLYP
jgi:hypothetical protein